ncbi:DUF4179 domain-containing protein [Lysinibacillus sphaericus]|uniref:DUF4179 domain-containing protein n=3 Tax=Lysinibacillus TaxID=400634 RepID=W7RP95_LYSSH|nr:hypothetical protein AR327_14855 [Lysinibacillus sphaericus]EWH32369.1 hypothetical protein P799_09435 [Lysinibacillus sphaericus CBAM5]MBE5083338.1 DUF4179 domain-containing protein [Bacillus thuringiensis]MBG9727833.1 hypothetical protein [Lysinibacillus fusiformis]AMR91273.1 hypothetical protein A1T07_14360 [Lysinibacillus sphaericus]
MSNMDDLMKEKVKYDQVDYPTENEMWSKIIRKQQNHNFKTKKHSYKPQVILTVIMFTIVLSATPVFAKYTTEILDWMRNMNRSGIITSLENGFGQEVNKTVENEAGLLNIHNIISDQNGTTINFSLDIDHEYPIDAADFEQALLKINDGKEIKLETNAVYNQETDQIVGILHTDEGIPHNSNVTLQLGGVKETQLKSVELKDVLQSNAFPEKITINQDGISHIEFTSNEYQNGQYTLDYLIDLEKSNNIENAYLSYKIQGENIANFGVTYKRPQPNVIKSSDSLEIPQEMVEKLGVFLSYTDTVSYKPDTWSLDFQYNQDLAKKSTFVMNIDEKIEIGSQQLQFNELVITPSEVKLYFDKKYIDSNSNIAHFNYRQFKLRIGEQELSGYNFKDYISFETLGLIKDITNKEISLTLNDAKVSYEAGKQDKVELTNISEVPKTINAELNGYPIDITYYTKGNDLIVESESKNEQFGGITQNVIYENGKRIFAETRSNDGVLRTHNQVETFKNIKEKDITLNFFLYTVNEDRAKTIVLQ